MQHIASVQILLAFFHISYCKLSALWNCVHVTMRVCCKPKLTVTFLKSQRAESAACTNA